MKTCLGHDGPWGKGVYSILSLGKIWYAKAAKNSNCLGKKKSAYSSVLEQDKDEIGKSGRSQIM